MTRKQRLLPNGKPKWVRIYDKPDCLDRYTILFTMKRFDGVFLYLSMSENGLGVCMWGESEQPLDLRSSSHLGKKIKFDNLSKDTQKIVRDAYCDLWEIKL